MKAQTFETSFKNYSSTNNISKYGQSALAKENTKQENSSNKALLDKKQTHEVRAVQSRHLRNIGTPPNKVSTKVGRILLPMGSSQILR